MDATPVRLWLRLEGAAALALGALLYARGEGSGLLFGLLFFAPDLSFAAYLGGARAGALVYNLLHSYTAPLLAAAAGLVLDAPLAVSVAAIWAAHIGFDRMLGYGLKLPEGFHATHLGRIGRGA